MYFSIKEIKFKDHERKMANFKSKHSAAPLEPRKILVVPKPRKPEAAIKPNQTFSANDSFDFTARKNTRVAPLKFVVLFDCHFNWLNSL